MCVIVGRFTRNSVQLVFVICEPLMSCTRCDRGDSVCHNTHCTDGDFTASRILSDTDIMDSKTTVSGQDPFARRRRKISVGSLFEFATKWQQNCPFPHTLICEMRHMRICIQLCKLKIHGTASRY